MDRNFVRFVAFVLSLCAAAAAVLVLALALLGMAGCSAETPESTWPESAESTWPESAEFSELETGQDRWSWHDTDDPFLDVVVDHSTGIEYLVYDDGYSAGLCPLLDADGTPLLVAEAGE